MGVDLKISGLDELRDRLDAMGKKVQKAEQEAILAGAEIMLKEVQKTTAFKDRTGKLRESLKISRVKKARGGGYIAWVGDIDKEANYSWYVEYGHSRAPAKPFMEPAARRARPEIRRIMVEKLKEAVGGDK